MTTFVLDHDLLGVDTQVTSTRLYTGSGHTESWIHHDLKLRVTRAFVVTGAGNAMIGFLLSFAPLFLLLRALGWLVLPLPSKQTQPAKQNLLVVWKTGTIWCANIEVTPWGPFVWLRITSQQHTTLHPNTAFMGGSGADHLTFDLVETLGVRRALAYAGARDPATSTGGVFFNLSTWSFESSALPIPSRAARHAWFALKTLCALLRVSPYPPPNSTSWLLWFINPGINHRV